MSDDRSAGDPPAAAVGRALVALERTIAERAVAADGTRSYTASLLAGEALLDAKVEEEAAELVRARSPAEVTHEAADLVYHVLVLLRRAGVPLVDVARELERRGGRSGLEEKASRGR